MRKRREINVFSISFLDLLSGALGAVIILYVALPKNNLTEAPFKDPVQEMIQRDLKVTQAELIKDQNEISSLKEKLIQHKVPPTVSNEKFDVGFKFKGKSIVFVIDTSYSMNEEDRMGQVKAGIKMLLTSLPADYQVDVVQFPLGERAPFRSMWGSTRKTLNANKQDAFDFIYNLKPAGGTPTRDALLFVLRNYNDISDIVLLSDGAPSLHNSNKKDDIYDILRVVRNENTRKIQINTIGVGSDFTRDKDNDQYVFLSLMAEETGGFFVGF